MKKMLAMALSLAMVISMAACGEKEPDMSEAVLTSGDSIITAGEYKYQLYNDVMSIAFANNGQNLLKGSELLNSKTEDGKTVKERAEANAKLMSERALAIKVLFGEKGLSLTENNLMIIDNFVNNPNIKAIANAIGLGDEDMRQVAESTTEMLELSRYLFTTEGEIEIPMEQMREEFGSYYRTAYVVPFYKVNEQGIPLSEEAAKKMDEQINQAYEDIKAGKSIVDVYYEVATSLVPEGAEKPEREADENYMMIASPADANYIHPILLQLLSSDEYYGEPVKIGDNMSTFIVLKVKPEDISDETILEFYGRMADVFHPDMFFDYVDNRLKDMDITYNDEMLSTITAENFAELLDELAAEQQEIINSAMTPSEEETAPQNEADNSDAEAEENTSEEESSEEPEAAPAA